MAVIFLSVLGILSADQACASGRPVQNVLREILDAIPDSWRKNDLESFYQLLLQSSPPLSCEDPSHPLCLPQTLRWTEYRKVLIPRKDSFQVVRIGDYLSSMTHPYSGPLLGEGSDHELQRYIWRLWEGELRELEEILIR